MKVHEGCIKHVFISLNARVKEEENTNTRESSLPLPSPLSLPSCAL